ncbi:MAG: Carboxynorspermidine/carboxyspermidine decarboxylase [Syntrophorhabdus sp. PtaU1.Bin050]|nr:MAG: Carboxynorspermidine/carboxyspermidine decarboxylase [Syntrophorhabdus sp. PtaU1.Bin050]
MLPDEPIQDAIHAISRRDASAANLYHALSGNERRKVLGRLDVKGLRSLTGLIKAAKKRRFAAANKRFLEIASGTAESRSTREPAPARTASENERSHAALLVKGATRAGVQSSISSHGEREGVAPTALLVEGATRAPIISSTPVYLIDETLIEENMRVLQYVKDRTDCKILHALKAYASFATFPMMSRYLDGTCASGLNEARLGREEFKKTVHTFGAAYKEAEVSRILRYSDSIIFNSFYQLKTYGEKAREKGVEIGLRVNPGHAEVENEMYNPCGPCSRLGIASDAFKDEFPKYRDMVDGLHFHAMCEQNSDVLQRILASFEKFYGPYIKGLKWVNFGGGHHITRDDYDIERLVRLVNNFKKRYRVQVYLEPGEASVLNAGVLIASVLDIVTNEMEIAIIDASAETHMPDVLLMPYRPNIMKSGKPNERRYTYRIAGPSCLAGDAIGDYSFDQPLKRGDRLVFTDMALYSIVKNTTFNGITLPDIAVVRDGGMVETVKKFGYKDYKGKQS